MSILKSQGLFSKLCFIFYGFLIHSNCSNSWTGTRRSNSRVDRKNIGTARELTGKFWTLNRVIARCCVRVTVRYCVYVIARSLRRSNLFKMMRLLRHPWRGSGKFRVALKVSLRHGTYNEQSYGNFKFWINEFFRICRKNNRNLKLRI